VVGQRLRRARRQQGDPTVGDVKLEQQWHGGNAMLGTSAGFQAVTMWRRESGSLRILDTPSVIWSITSPAGVGQARHCRP
jgi:hypothetical protein